MYYNFLDITRDSFISRIYFTTSTVYLDGELRRGWYCIYRSGEESKRGVGCVLELAAFPFEWNKTGRCRNWLVDGTVDMNFICSWHQPISRVSRHL